LGRAGGHVDFWRRSSDLAVLIRGFGVGKIAEFGTFLGYSALAMLRLTVGRARRYGRKRPETPRLGAGNIQSLRQTERKGGFFVRRRA